MTQTALQMWTVRHEAQRRLPETLDRLRTLGYGAVETAGLYGRTPAQMRGALDSAGLTLCSAHQGIPEPAQADEVFAQLSELGATSAFASLDQEHWTDADTVRRSADRLNAAVDTAAGHGIGYGYHNHWWEFASQVDDRPAFDLFLELLDPRALLQVDTYWAETGGASAAKLVSSLGPRVPSLHIKDGPADLADPEAPQVAVGAGTLNIKEIVSASPSVQWNIIELDDYDGDIWEAVARSIDYLSSLDRLGQ